MCVWGVGGGRTWQGDAPVSGQKMKSERRVSRGVACPSGVGVGCARFGREWGSGLRDAISKCRAWWEEAGLSQMVWSKLMEEQGQDLNAGEQPSRI